MLNDKPNAGTASFTFALGAALVLTPFTRGQTAADGTQALGKAVDRSRVGAGSSTAVAPRAASTYRLVQAGVTKAPDDQKPAALTGRKLGLQVIAADTGKPLARATVNVSFDNRRQRHETDDLGRLEIVHSTGPADTSVVARVQSEGYVPQQHIWGRKPGESIPEDVTIRLRPGETTLGGLVHDERDRPIEGATVFLWSNNITKKDPHELMFDLQATTGADGRWQTHSAPELTGELIGIRLVHPDFVSDRGYTMRKPVPPIAKLRDGSALAVMKKGIAIEGRVVDAEGRAVAGALVIPGAAQGREHFAWVEPFSVETNAEGRFKLAPANPDQAFCLLARAAGHAPGSQQVTAGDVRGPVEIRLGRPRVLEGRVIDSNAKPIPGAMVIVDTWRRQSCLGVIFASDDRGRFRWTEAPDDAFNLYVQKDGYVSQKSRPVTSADNEIVFSLERSLTITGSIRDAATGKSVAQCDVEAGLVDAKTGQTTWIRPDRSMGIGSEIRATLSAEADPTYRLRITAQGYEPFLSREFKGSERQVSYDVKLKPAGAGPPAAPARPSSSP